MDAIGEAWERGGRAYLKSASTARHAAGVCAPSAQRGGGGGSSGGGADPKTGGAPTQGPVENEEGARPVRGGGGHRPKDRRGGGHRPEDRLDVDGSRRRFKLGFARGRLRLCEAPDGRGFSVSATGASRTRVGGLVSLSHFGCLHPAARHLTEWRPRLVQPELSAG